MKKNTYTIPLALVFCLFFLWAISSNLLLPKGKKKAEDQRQRYRISIFFHGIIIFLFRHVFNIWQYRKISKSIEFPGIFSKEQPFFIFLQIG